MKYTFDVLYTLCSMRFLRRFSYISIESLIKISYLWFTIWPLLYLLPACHCFLVQARTTVYKILYLCAWTLAQYTGTTFQSTDLRNFGPASLSTTSFYLSNTFSGKITIILKFPCICSSRFLIELLQFSYEFYPIAVTKHSTNWTHLTLA